MKTLTPKTLLLAAAIGALPVAMSPVAISPAAAHESFAPLVKTVKPAVVTVLVKGRQQSAAEDMQIPEQFRDFFERFGQPMPEPRGQGRQPMRGMGSGFVIEASGVIVTNNHVVDGADEVTVILDDGTELVAEVVGTDEKVDIAVLRVDAGRDLPTVAWGDSDAIEVGDWAVAIGNPLGLNGTVTAGIVSARGRDINAGPYDDFLQVDAAINRGNSGGPLFDTEGKVIGVNSAIISPSGGSVGLGFAIPAKLAQRIVADLLDDGKVERGWIGVSIQNVSPDISDSLGLDAAKGALVAEVMPDSPAAAAGLKSGDVILSFAGRTIDEVRDLTTTVADASIGAAQDIQVWRNGSIETLSITPGLMETASLDMSPPVEAPRASSSVEVPELGLALKSSGDGVVIDATPGAADSGLAPGDAILSVNQVQVSAPEDVAKVVSDAARDGRKKVLLLIERDGGKRFVTLDLNAA